STNATAAAGSVVFEKLIVTTDNSLDGAPATGNTSVFDMVFGDPADPNVLLATDAGVAAGSGVFRSTNALAATPTFTQTLTVAAGVRLQLAISGAGVTATVYAATSEASTNVACPAASRFGRLRKSTDGGQTFPTIMAAAEGYCAGQCVYDMPIGVSATDPNLVYIGGNARGTCSDVLKRSTNGGTTFTQDDNGLHADSHAIVFDMLTTPPTVFFATDGGIFKRQDAAAGSPWINLNTTGLGTIQFVSVAVHPTDQNLTIGGTQDNGTEAQFPTSGTWVSAESGDGGFAIIDQSSVAPGSAGAPPNVDVVMYHTFFNQRNNFFGFDRTMNTVCLASKDSWEWRGTTFANDPTPSCDGTDFSLQNGMNVADFVAFYAPMATGPGTPNTLYFGSDKLYRSTNRGDTMTAVSAALQAIPGAFSPITAIGISPQNDNVRIAGVREGHVFSTTTGAALAGANFTPPANPNGSTTNRQIGDAVIDPLNVNTAYVTLSYFAPAGQGIWKTTNLNAGGAATWTASGNGIPSIPINALVVSPIDSNFLWAGTDIGVYASTDGGANWAPFGTGLPRVAVFDLALQPTSRILRAATHGRGMWEIADVQLAVELESIEVE
ncbi:MAG TPA: hypothetical protein VN923_13690, partial [Thermoanaerobaculia bacterium]|nr:hypothetical protein [Thermoanaerobaculia bacterium]